MNPHELVTKWLRELNLAMQVALKEANYYKMHHLNKLRFLMFDLRDKL
jgi:hypothetical protein